MDDNEQSVGLDKQESGRSSNLSSNNPFRAFDFLVQVREKFRSCLESVKFKAKDAHHPVLVEKKEPVSYGANLEKQLRNWRENPFWIDHPPNVEVSVPKGSLCNLNVNFEVGLPPDAVFNIITDPDNKRVFRNIKEVISRRVLIDEGQRQLVELEQAAAWKFLWWSGVISVHVLVDQDRRDYSVKFKQGKAGFMERFEGVWAIRPLFIDQDICKPIEPKTWYEYQLCSNDVGRVGSSVSLQQLVQPSLVPPPPISWYLRGITARTTEMLITDLLAESARIREGRQPDNCFTELSSNDSTVHQEKNTDDMDLKQRWRDQRHRKQRRRKQRR